MLLQTARECWEQLSGFRAKRNRCRDYTFGRQWNDMIEVDGRRMSEYEYIMSEGNVPLKNNLIRRLVRNVVGVFRERLPEIMKEEYGGDMEAIAQANSMEEIFCRSMEEYLISGMVVHRKRIVEESEGGNVRTEIVSPGSFFYNTDSRDVRGWDLSVVGQIHRVDMNEWCRAFVKNREEYKEAEKLFEGGKKVNVIEMWRRELRPFYLIHDRKRGFLFKGNEKEAREKLGKDYSKKWKLEEVWRYYFLTEDGTVMACGDTPLPSGSHPYVMKCYPMLDGEIQSFVGDLIDQQRYTNRLITLYDWVIRASAKGVLLLPKGSVDPKNLRAVADQWGRFNGVIVYDAKAGLPEPKQISGRMSNLGISELLEIQLKMLEDVSGVNGILQGNTGKGNVSGELYKSQTQNAMYSLADLLETFRGFIKESAALDRKIFGHKNMEN